MRALRFSTGAQWHITQPTPINDFKWENLEADGVTDLGRALHMVAEQLRIPPMTDRALPPVLVLISDGQPTDDFNAGLKALLKEPWGKKAVRVAIAIGEDADHEILQKFIGNPEFQPLQANNPEALKNKIKWTSTVVLKAASAPTSQTEESQTSGNVPIPQAHDTGSEVISAGDIW